MVKICSDPDVRNKIIETMVMRLDGKEAISFLRKNNINICERSYYYAKKKIRNERFKRIKQIFDYEFMDEYLQAIETMKDCEKKMYKAADEEQNPYKRTEIYTQIINLQPIKIEFYHNTRKMIQRRKADQLLQDSLT